MKYPLFVCIGIGLFSLSGHASVLQQRLVVDSVKALNLINGEIDKVNELPLRKIERLKDSRLDYDGKKRKAQENADYLNSIKGKLTPKIKDSAIRREMEEFFDASFNLMPPDSILAYCKEKDVAKAMKSKNSNEELNKIKSRFREKMLKRIAKGDMSSAYLSACVNYLLTKSGREVESLDTEIINIERQLESENKKVIEKPTRFNASDWNKYGGNFKIPTKVISVEVEEDLTGGLSFKELEDKYYKSSENPGLTDTDMSGYTVLTDADMMVIARNNNESVEGLFNGLIEDKVNAFPADIFSRNYIEYASGSREKGKFDIFNKVLILSEKGIIPPQKMPIGFDVANSEWGTPLMIEKLHTYWDDSEERKDGISIFANYYESTDGEKMLLFFDGENWQPRIPDDAEYLSYDESMNRIRKNGNVPQILKLSIHSEDFTGRNYNTDCSFLVVTDRLIGHTKEDDDSVVLKYKKEYNGIKREGNCKIDVPGFKKIYVDSNYRDYKGGVVVAEGSVTAGSKVIRKKYIFMPYNEENGAYVKVNGHDTLNEDYGLYLIGEGTYDSASGNWNIKEVNQEWGDL